jgi:hypothetical protein
LIYQERESCWSSGIGQTVVLSGTAKQLVCQEQESCWSVRNKRPFGLSGQEICYPVRRKLLVCQERWSCLPTKNIRAVGLAGTKELLVCQEGRIAAGLSGTEEELVCQQQVKNRKVDGRKLTGVWVCRDRLILVCQRQELW